MKLGESSMLCALIMAGGKGERFWPLSTEKKPKQFLKLLGEETMIQMTVKRIQRFIPIDNIFIVTGKQYLSLVEEQLPNIRKENIIIEPEGKNTAPCITLGAFVINKRFQNATLVVVPSDHLVVDEDQFIKSITAACFFVDKYEENIVTIGTKPDRAETGFGYIKYGELEIECDNTPIKKVEKFVEKPNIDKAKEYFKDGTYLWNSGIFIWNVSTILKLAKQYLSSTYNTLAEVALAADNDFNRILEEKYKQVDNISIDYGIIEKAENVYVIPAEFGWDDVGTWHSVERYRNKDENNNVFVGDIRNIDSHDNIVVSNEKPIVLVGLNNIFIVETEDIIFVGSKENINNIKEIKTNLNLHKLL